MCIIPPIEDLLLDHNKWFNDPRIRSWHYLFQRWKSVPSLASAWSAERDTFRKDSQLFWRLALCNIIRSCYYTEWPMNDETEMTARRVLKIGHRGAAGHAPENTLAGVEMGIRLGADLVEVDVQITCDGHLVLMHDRSVRRTTGAEGRLSEMSLEQARKLDAGNGQRIPLLREVLELANQRIGLILESKTPGSARLIIREASKFGFEGPVVVASFNHPDLVCVRETYPDALVMALLEGIPVQGAQFAVDAGATHAGIALDSMTIEFGRTLRQAGLQVFLYTANEPEEIQLAKSLGADGIISNFPERI